MLSVKPDIVILEPTAFYSVTNPTEIRPSLDRHVCDVIILSRLLEITVCRVEGKDWLSDHRPHNILIFAEIQFNILPWYGNVWLFNSCAWHSSKLLYVFISFLSNFICYFFVLSLWTTHKLTYITEACLQSVGLYIYFFSDKCRKNKLTSSVCLSKNRKAFIIY